MIVQYLGFHELNKLFDFVEMYSQFFSKFICLLKKFKDFKAPACFFVYFSKALPKGQCVNLACFII